MVFTSKMFEKHPWNIDILSKYAGQTNYLASASVEHWSESVNFQVLDFVFNLTYRGSRLNPERANISYIKYEDIA